tara:strand:+ start:929 stop:1882 length:954 start_codon:yes stop_codon:yes gene_type:complete
MNKDSVSIIIPCFNGEKYLEAAIISVLNQSYKNFNLFLINNGSTDNSLEIMRKFEKIDSRIKVISYEEKTSRGHSVNEILNISNDKWISLLDTDDIMLPHKTEIQINFLKKNPSVKIVSGLGTYINTENNKTYGISVSPIVDFNTCFELINRGKNISTIPSCVIFDRNIVKEIGGFRDKFWPADDTDLWNRIVENGHILFIIQKVLIKYRIHSESITYTDFIKGKIIGKWMNHCLNLRLKRKKEISFEEFFLSYKKKNIIYKIVFYSKNYSNFFFRQCIVYMINRNYIKLFMSMFISLILDPMNFLKKIMSRMQKIF